MPSTPCPLFGTLQLELNNFLEYANEPVGSLRRGNSVNIRGMSWQLGAELTESAAEDGTKYLGLNLYCNNNCKIVQIVANVKPDQPCGTSLPRTDAILVKTSNDQIGVEVNINRNLLAAHSNSFNDFLANFQPPAESTSSNGGLNITLDAPSTAEHFEQLMDLLHYGDCVLEDENLENVLRLAQQFHLHDIVSKCARFLGSTNCNIQTMKKYQIADIYGLDALKEFILYNLLQESDFVAQYFLQNLEIIEQLSDGAKIALKQRIKELLEAAQ
ncbi:hypothetical protein niasHS_007007 [Heterodera schachtii]|uniref:BTB domain-containing protein n=1 Tax=Heterodera schachtii TaxID=97005 RepID=A0ABD2JF94_HETSC